MTPERAAEIAKNAAKYTCGSGVDADVIIEAILLACTEQRETDAMICEENYTIEGIAQRCAAAIREGK
jgi:hypothetical protein